MRVVLARERLVSVGIDPRLLREPPETVAEVVAGEIDAALRDRPADDEDVPRVEPLALARELRAVRAELDARMARVRASIQASAAGLREEAEVPGDVPTLDFGELFDPLVEVLETIGGVPVEDLRGESGGPVSAVCAPGPRLVSLRVTPRAMGGGSRELGERVAGAVNAALDDLAAGLLRRREEAGAEQIMARVAELRELGVLRMQAYVQEMTGMMAGIRPRA
ncbi:hypothetical protein SAMN05444920_117114 [Nonomuraea solani]|uniref:YbaB/EbfC DNA-binding family protein n=1 Tax=Nonomuraea solani TaxID=1144553 RepID=A0A1H6ETE6_9ACTN|nr:hypothetical protein [Nonomuraea solani]SEH00683.1 hypothetical protein SAMN05444920_117114 [Nonomuraea solani]